MKNLGIPVAIVIAGALIAGAVIYNNNSSQITPDNTDQLTGHTINMPEISASDHIRGDINASVKIVEYSDTECPFCKRFHETMKTFLSENNEVAWVYRHFPIESLHKKAIKEAEATECVADIAGEDAFWTYLDSIYETTESNDSLTDEQLFSLAEDVSVKRANLEQCLNEGKFSEKIKNQIEEAQTAGATGTPYNVVVLEKELSDEQIEILKSLDLQITQNHPTQRILKVDTESKDKISLFGALPIEILNIILDIVLEREIEETV